MAEKEDDKAEKKQDKEERQLASTFVADPVQCNSLNSYLNDSYRWKFITTIRSTTNDNTSFSLPQVSRSSGIR